MEQVKVAVKIAEVKYPQRKGYKHVWIFDHSSCNEAVLGGMSVCL